jgi:hypothetical protein
VHISPRPLTVIPEGRGFTSLRLVYPPPYEIPIGRAFQPCNRQYYARLESRAYVILRFQFAANCRLPAYMN